MCSRRRNRIDVAPSLLPRSARFGNRLGNAEIVDGMYRDGFFCPLAQLVMGETAEVLAEQYQISREEQDRFALVSQQRAEAAIKPIDSPTKLFP